MLIVWIQQKVLDNNFHIYVINFISKFVILCIFLTLYIYYNHAHVQEQLSFA